MTDQMNGSSTLWKDGIIKAMKNISTAFEILEEYEKIPVRYPSVTCHLIFDVKMDFKRKVHYAFDGRKTEDHIIITFAGVVSRESN